MDRPGEHDPQVLPMADVADKWVVRCDCGCGVYTEYAAREDADEAAERARAEAGPPTAHGRAVEEAHEQAPEPI
ncbi:hypothetical protein [Pseudonocardia spirodelae]|uniref:DUF2188 domain-containing protein n=1 Tax=Pseudonocardia spirodelae TaxID=3133431 RepID=A0ABU8T273_9PSEU